MAGRSAPRRPGSAPVGSRRRRWRVFGSRASIATIVRRFRTVRCPRKTPTTAIAGQRGGSGRKAQLPRLHTGMIPRLRARPFDVFVPRELEPPGDRPPRVARIDHVVDEAPAGDFVDVDVLLDHRDDLLLHLGRRLLGPNSFLAAMPTMPSAPITLISAVGQATIRSGS